jgi:hypothetical protein
VIDGSPQCCCGQKTSKCLRALGNELACLKTGLKPKGKHAVHELVHGVTDVRSPSGEEASGNRRRATGAVDEKAGIGEGLGW